MKKQKTRAYLLFISAFFAICLVPSVGLFWNHSDAIDNAEAKDALPQITNDEGTLNLDYLGELGSYFETHFAYRAYAVDLNAHIRVALSATSPTDQVIVGDSGWLYYGGTLDDYLGNTPLTKQKARAIAHNLSLVQGYAQSKGATFTFTIAPNKNSLYPAHMPYYYTQGDQTNRTVLKEALDAAGVSYADLFEAFENTHEELYYKTDTHWNPTGALLAAQSILENNERVKILEKASENEPSSYEHTGDIETMLYPVTAGSETTSKISVGSWNGLENNKSVEDSLVETYSQEGAGSLFMFRDSFADSLIPLLSPLYEKARYSKLIPYNFLQFNQDFPEHIIIERAERHVGLLAENPPLMMAPRVAVGTSTPISGSASVSVSEDGDYHVISGIVDPTESKESDDILIRISTENTTATFIPFYQTIIQNGSTENDNGFRLYLPKASFSEGFADITVLIVHKNADGSYDSVGQIETTRND